MYLFLYLVNRSGIFLILISANTNDDPPSNGCNQTISFPCAEFMCLDYSLQCNGRKNCWNFAYDELNCGMYFTYYYAWPVLS